MTPPVYVINRDVDADRWAACAAAARAQGVEPKRISAVDGHAAGFDAAPWRDLVGAHFWGGGRIKPGAFACAISHRAAWLAVLDQGAPMALICEDDALLVEPPGRAAAVAGGLGEVDVLFANARLAGWTDGVGAAQPLPDVVARGAGGGAPGADCYLVTRRGAARLVDLLARLRVVCGVDWAMVWGGIDSRALTPAALAAWPELGVLAGHLVPGPPALAAHVLVRPLAATPRGGPSVLRHRVTVALADLVRPVRN